MFRSSLLTFTFLAALQVEAAPPVVLENEHLRIEFSADDGSITRLRNERADLDLISVVSRSPQP